MPNGWEQQLSEIKFQLNEIIKVISRDKKSDEQKERRIGQFAVIIFV